MTIDCVHCVSEALCKVVRVNTEAHEALAGVFCLALPLGLLCHVVLFRLALLLHLPMLQWR